MNAAGRILLGLMLVGAGWAAGYARRSEPEFVIQVEAPSGATRVECVSGCELLGGRDLGNAGAARLKAYEFGCSAATGERCTAPVGGWACADVATGSECQMRSQPASDKRA